MSERARCPTCGQITDSVDAQGLLALLTHGVPHREVYHGRDGGWFVTHGGGEVSGSVVAGLVEQGRIVSVYSDCPHEAYHVGRTLDIPRTMEERKKYSRAKDAPKIYVGDEPTPPIAEGR